MIKMEIRSLTIPYAKKKVACEQAHLVCYSRVYLGGGSRARFARRLAGGGCQDCRAQIPQTSEPARRQRKKLEM